MSCWWFRRSSSNGGSRAANATTKLPSEALRMLNLMEETNQTGGYDHTFIEGESLLNDSICLICRLVAREPYQVNCCGKIFCLTCLVLLMTKSKSSRCPNCRERLIGNCFPDKRASREINQLRLYCDNRERGCTWEGCLKEEPNHYQTCPHREVNCPNLCGEAVKYTKLREHLLTSCPFRIVKCRHCQKKGVHLYIAGSHLKTCPDVMIPCPNQDCTQQCQRKDVDSHRSVCPKELLHCEYADLGCDHMCVREELSKHATQAVQDHLHLACMIGRSCLESLATPQNVACFRMRNLTAFRDSKRPWYSHAFYTSPAGYKMRLGVRVAGLFSTISDFCCRRPYASLITVSLHLMEGMYDHVVEWPIRGVFAVQILNQAANGIHLKKQLSCLSREDSTCNSWVTGGKASEGLLSVKFKLASASSYLMNDSMYIKVKTVEIKSATKPWLAGAI